MKLKVNQVIIKEYDLIKLMKPKGIRSSRHLAKIAGVNYSYLNRCVNNKFIMSEKTWNKIKVCL